MVGVLGEAGTDWQGGGCDVRTVELLLSLLAVPLSVTDLVLADAGSQPTPEHDQIMEKFLFFTNKCSDLKPWHWSVMSGAGPAVVRKARRPARSVLRGAAVEGREKTATAW